MSGVTESEKGDWFCPECRDYLSSSRVTFEEKCDTCFAPVEWHVLCPECAGDGCDTCDHDGLIPEEAESHAD